MKKIKFTKMAAAGNDFVVIEGLKVSRFQGLKVLAREICDRKYGVGADGLLLLEKSKIADVKMRIFNADGSEAEMCGNGARCAAYVIARSRRRRSNLKKSDCFAPAGLAMTIETKAGMIAAEVKDDIVKIRLTDPKSIKLDIPIIVNNRRLKVNFINTGVPHAIIFVEGLDKIDVSDIGRQIRFNKKFFPAGTNVDFVEVLGKDSIMVRTYERGVEDETLACGTGSVAASLIFCFLFSVFCLRRVNVHTRSKEMLKVYFERDNHKFKNVWLEGAARMVYKGEYYV